MPLNIYMTGVGGQGIGLLAGILSDACSRAGYHAMGCDTLGVAQRGGIVESHLRIGKKVFGPMIPKGDAHLVLALERLEALRAMRQMLRSKGTVIYYDIEIQPVHVRMNRILYPPKDEIKKAAAILDANVHPVEVSHLTTPVLQNAALLGYLGAARVIPQVDEEVIISSMKTTLSKKSFGANLEVFKRAATLVTRDR